MIIKINYDYQVILPDVWTLIIEFPISSVHVYFR